MNKFISWIKLHKLEFAIITLILVVAAFLRLYKIDQYLTFLGDEGRDVLIVKALLERGDVILIGPPTSIGNMYLGPLYYYLMALPLFVTGFNPVGPAIMVAVLGILTVWLVYFVGKQFFKTNVGLIAASLYAVSPVNIFYSRSSWNPNPMPFFALLTFYSLWMAFEKKKPVWLLLTGISLAFALQMHYLGTLLLPIVGLVWLIGFLINKKELNSKKLLLFSSLGIIIFLTLMSPLVFFDLRHGFINYNAFKKFFFERQTTLNVNPLNSLIRIIPIFTKFFADFFTLKKEGLGQIVLAVVLIGWVLKSLNKLKRRNYSFAYLIISVWFFAGILGMSLYKQTIYVHYFGFVNPAGFLLVGLVLAFFYNRHFLFKPVIFIIVLGLIVFNLTDHPFKYPPNRQLYRTREISKEVIAAANGQEYNFALIAKNNYDAAYQYYLELYDFKPQPLDDKHPSTLQLFVVCEDPVCEPVGHPKQEISHFGWSKIDKAWDFNGVKLFKLIPNPSGKPS